MGETNAQTLQRLRVLIQACREHRERTRDATPVGHTLAEYSMRKEREYEREVNKVSDPTVGYAYREQRRRGFDGYGGSI